MSAGELPGAAGQATGVHDDARVHANARVHADARADSNAVYLPEGAPLDLILVGGGLANGLLAWRLATERPDVNFLVLEGSEHLGGNHTWSFHDSDIDPAQRAWLAPVISCSWQSYQVVFPERQRTLHSGYASIASDDFARVVGPILGERLRLGVAVTDVTPTSVRLATGQTLTAAAVVDGRGPRASEHLALGYQTFLGQEVRLAQPHGMTAPIIMDASVPQGGGYRFVYVLPFGPDRLLIEDTHYVDHHRLTDDILRANVTEYARSKGWTIAEVIREERGSLPIILAGDTDAFWADIGQQPTTGLRAALFHPTTGYSLPHALRLAWRLAALPDLRAPALFAAIRDEARQEWRAQGYFRLLNRMLFLAGRSDDRWRVMQRFYGLSEGLIRRFYAGRLAPHDKLRILVGKPPVPVAQAMKAALAVHPHRIRNYE
ncbi:lycopene beta-cyclase CrtY [Pigmentiphaga litoralis]|uniref:Lycopene beta-cyclase n=1 Tax=Pigmentiphaga litoralis TaxID=516702 RepID=A0A7Y9IZ85_9BURK|nr:lycopene beta-cyclase [Pigmentiphaga litoralis]NYE85118.1 lycopene beta-cyclase [Pigmentiphaga litoralis]